jgi:hypothetical protein
MLACAPAAISKLHAQLKHEFASQLQFECMIDQHPGIRNNDWTRLGFQGRIIFELYVSPDAGTHQEFSKVDSRRAPIIQLFESEDAAGECIWVSWREEWEKGQREDPYELRNAGLTFYFGRPFNVESKLFRAEWAGERNAPKNAAHPHWHFDYEVYGSGIAVNDIHFGMASWIGASSPECWQRFPNKPEDVSNWAGRILEYSRSQLVGERTRPGPID